MRLLCVVIVSIALDCAQAGDRAWITLPNGQRPPEAALKEAGDTCYNEARVEALKMAPSYRGGLDGIARLMEQEELTKRTYELCLRRRGYRVQWQ